MLLFIPQWQGAGQKSQISSGLAFLRKQLQGYPITTAAVSDQAAGLKNGIWHYDVILANLKQIKKTLSENKPDKLFTIGGECSIELAPVSYLNEKYSRDLQVIWLDAHADLNTPLSSPSHHFHGMPARMLLGEGDQQIKAELPGLIEPEQLILAGLRNLDEPEKDYIHKKNIRVISCAELLDESGRVLKRAITKKNFYIHIDLDVLDPDDFPFTVYKHEGGVSLADLTRVITNLHKSSNIVGLSIVEYNDESGFGAQKLAGLLRLCAEIVSKE